MNGWLLFFYTVPARPVGNRMRIWRKLARIGAVQMKGAVYLLPDQEEHRENLQWLSKETSACGGEAGWAHTERIHPFKEAELRELFNRQRTAEYDQLKKKLADLQRRTAAYQKGGQPPKPEILRKQFRKLRDELQTIARIDFFASETGQKMAAELGELEEEIARLLAQRKEPASKVGATLRRGNFQGRTWVTRPRPFVDRLASAWLIRRFIDPQASFAFRPEEEISAAKGEMVSYDVADGDFTHQQDLCTFETLIRRFGLTDPALRPLAEIVHDLDLKDDRYGNPAAAGVEAIIVGLGNRSRSDQEILAQGLQVFDALYAFFGGQQKT